MCVVDLMRYVCRRVDEVCVVDEEVKEFMRRHGWKRFAGGEIFIANQEENVKTKNIKENINFDSALLFYIFSTFGAIV